MQNMLQQYQKIKNDAAYNFAKSKTFLNNFGYTLLADCKVKVSLIILKPATEEFPTDVNTLDSYTEALKTDGQNPPSIDYYKRILILDPNNKSAQDAVKELQEKLK